MVFFFRIRIRRTFFPKTSWNMDSTVFRSISSDFGSSPEAAFLCKICKCLPLSIIQFQVAFLDAAADCFVWQWLSDKYSNNGSKLDGHAHSAVVSALGLYALRFPLTPWIFSWYYELWMVRDLNYLQSCTEKHCLWTDWQLSHTIWHKVVNHDPSLLTKTKPLVDAPFILNLDNLTCYQLHC